MQVENATHPNDAQMAGFAEPGADGPIYMLNLLKYKDKAEYPDGSDADITTLVYDSETIDGVVYPARDEITPSGSKKRYIPVWLKLTNLRLCCASCLVQLIRQLTCACVAPPASSS